MMSHCPPSLCPLRPLDMPVPSPTWHETSHRVVHESLFYSLLKCDLSILLQDPRSCVVDPVMGIMEWPLHCLDLQQDNCDHLHFNLATKWATMAKMKKCPKILISYSVLGDHLMTPKIRIVSIGAMFIEIWLQVGQKKMFQSEPYLLRG